MRYCEHCGKQLPNEDSFCTECGYSIEGEPSTLGEETSRENPVKDCYSEEKPQADNVRYCEHCGKQLPDEDMFCTECGYSIDGESSKESSSFEEVDFQQNPDSTFSSVENQYTAYDDATSFADKEMAPFYAMNDDVYLNEPEPAPRKRRTPIILSLIALVVLIAGAGAWWYLSYYDGTILSAEKNSSDGELSSAAEESSEISELSSESQLDTDSLLQMAEKYIDDGDLVGAINIYEYILEQSPEDEATLESLEQLRLSYKNNVLEEAQKLIEEQRQEEAVYLLIDAKDILGESAEIDLVLASLQSSSSVQANYHSEDPAVGYYILPQSSERALTYQDVVGLTQQELMLARNEIYARHGRIFNDATIRSYFESQAWYSGYIAPEDFSENLLSRTEKDNVAFIRECENELKETSNTPIYNPIGNSSTPSQEKPPSDSQTDTSIDTSAGTTPSQPTEPEDEVEVESVVVNGVTFRYVSSHIRYSIDGEKVTDYNIDLDIKYCEPSDYVSEDSRITAMYRSNGGIYSKDEVGDLYYSDSQGDFAVFEVSISGDYEASHIGTKNIEFRKYTPYGILLKNMNGITDYELVCIDSNIGSAVKGEIDETFYIGVFTSEVGRIDFKMFAVGPGGWGNW